jgi:hypothetical protein
MILTVVSNCAALDANNSEYRQGRDGVNEVEWNFSSYCASIYSARR